MENFSNRYLTNVSGIASTQDISVPVVDIFILSTINISEKKIKLSQTPRSPNSVNVLPDGGIEQRINIDYNLNVDEISWSGLTLDGFLEEGEILRVTYLA